MTKWWVINVHKTHHKRIKCYLSEFKQIHKCWLISDFLRSVRGHWLTEKLREDFSSGKESRNLYTINALQWKASFCDLIYKAWVLFIICVILTFKVFILITGNQTQSTILFCLLIASAVSQQAPARIRYRHQCSAHSEKNCGKY